MNPVDGIERAIHDRVEVRAAEIIETFRSAVAIPTSTPPGSNYDRMVEFFASDFEGLGFAVERVDLPDEVFEGRVRRFYPEAVGTRANLLARREGDGHGMVFYTHIDTMPVGDADTWTVDPFSAEVRDGYVWGRGTADSKGGAVAILWAFRVLDELELKPSISPRGCADDGRGARRLHRPDVYGRPGRFWGLSLLRQL